MDKELATLIRDVETNNLERNPSYLEWREDLIAKVDAMINRTHQRLKEHRRWREKGKREGWL